MKLTPITVQCFKKLERRIENIVFHWVIVSYEDQDILIVVVQAVRNSNSHDRIVNLKGFE